MDYIDYNELKNKNAEHFWYRARNEFIAAWLNNTLKEYDPNRSILDVGSGTGYELKELKKFGQVIALDRNQEALDIASKAGHRTILADLEEYREENNIYDVICCFDLLEHLSLDQTALNKLYRSLKPGGLLFVTVPAYPFLFSAHDRAMGHVRRYRKKELEFKLANSGFSSIEMFFWNSWLFPLFAFWRLTAKVAAKLNPRRKYRSDARLAGGIIDPLFYFALKLENRLHLRGIRLPFGLTISAVAKK